MNFKNLKRKLWFNIFIRIAIVFTVFVMVLFVANISFLVDFFVVKKKAELVEQLTAVSKLDLEDTPSILNKLSEITENHNFDVEIYSVRGPVLFTTHGGQMLDYIQINNDMFKMSHEEMIPIKTEKLSDGIIFQTAVRRFDNSEYLICSKEISDGIIAEVRIQKQIISNSAAIANQFIIIVASVCFVFSIIWVFIFAKKFSKPLSEMNEITKDMANLNFKRKIEKFGDDEIGQLSLSINELSDSLSAALISLQEKNRKLQDDIEAERRLDAMRKAFVANVSHELKTPIAIINGYAEGLKLDINPKDREEYCNTIIEEGNRMNRLVLSILELSKYESGQIPVNKQPVDISALTDNIMKKMFANSNIAHENKVPKGIKILVDAAQIEQVLIALLENALAHTPSDGRVWVDSSGDKTVRISVFNTGSHVDSEKMPEIWQSFYRGDSSHKRDNSRFGLGLSIVSAIIKMHNSNCGVYNTDDGVCFWFESERAEADGE
ncbi:MAG: HAMP domain-containing sensor histidine kinase [Acutalibacteraceae bacterium]